MLTLARGGQGASRNIAHGEDTSTVHLEERGGEGRGEGGGKE